MEDTIILSQIIEIISKITRIDSKEITEENSLREDLWIDSLQAIQIISKIEETFNIKIDEVEIFNVDTISDIKDLIKEYMYKEGK